MFNRIKTYLSYGNLFCGVEQTSKDGSDLVHVTVLKKNKANLETKTRFELHEFGQLKTRLSKNQHIALILNNKHVLSKQIEGNERDPLKILNRAFPNINIDDFYYEILTEKDHQFISICRTDYVDKLINDYRENGLSIIHISLGNNIMQSVLNFFKKEEIFTSKSKLKVQNNTLLQIENLEIPQNINYNLNGLETNNFYVLSTAGALILLLHNYRPKTNLNVLKKDLLSNYQQKRFFNLFLKAGGTFTFALLLINFLIFNHYYTNVQKLQQSAQFNQSTKKKILALNEKVLKSQKMVEDMLKSDSSKSSFYLNSITQILPETILLSDFNYQPISKRIKEGQDIQIDKNVIIMRGTTTNSALFSDWLTRLEKLYWVSSMGVLNYEDLNVASKFSIKLVINDE